jgi:peptide/nickel transport system ATP-binding protein
MSQTTPSNQTPLLEIKNLQVGFRNQRGIVPAVNGIDLTLMPGQTLAIVGESGSGKSTTAHAIINLLPGSGVITGGEVLFEGRDIAKLSENELEEVRGKQIGFVPQDPMANLNPVWSIGFQVEEAIRANGIATNRKDVKRRAIEVLKEAGLADADRRLRQFPHQFSGGMRQRVLIGMGLAANPKLLIADEPTSALDVTVQRVILDHLATLTRDLGTAVLFITHDLGLAAERAEQLVVMYKGKIVESGPSRELLENPLHPYTQRLVAAAPSLASRRIRSASKSLADLDYVAPAAAEGLDLLESVEVRAEAHAATSDLASVIVVDNLTKVFKIRGQKVTAKEFKAVDDVSFSIARGTTLALVGESGSGKSTVAKLLLKLEEPTSGSIKVDGTDIARLRGKDVLAFRRKTQPVFQDPYGSLDPLRNIGATIAEPLHVHGVGTKAERRARVLELLDQVALPSTLATRYPNELSGGQRQRVAIARAVIVPPAVLLCDEPTSALDVSLAATVLNLLGRLRRELNMSVLFVTHDLAAARIVADRIAVMNKGQIVEIGDAETVCSDPQNDYTRALLSAIPGQELRLATQNEEDVA